MRIPSNALLCVLSLSIANAIGFRDLVSGWSSGKSHAANAEAQSNAETGDTSDRAFATLPEADAVDAVRHLDAVPNAIGSRDFVIRWSGKGDAATAEAETSDQRGHAFAALPEANDAVNAVDAGRYLGVVPNAIGSRNLASGWSDGKSNYATAEAGVESVRTFRRRDPVGSQAYDILADAGAVVDAFDMGSFKDASKLRRTEDGKDGAPADAMASFGIIGRGGGLRGANEGVVESQDLPNEAFNKPNIKGAQARYSVQWEQTGGAASGVEADGDENLSFEDVPRSGGQGEYPIAQDPHRKLISPVQRVQSRAVSSNLPAAVAPRRLPFEDYFVDVAPREPVAAADEPVQPKDKDHSSIVTFQRTTAEIGFRWFEAITTAAPRFLEAQGADTGQGHTDGAPTAIDLVGDADVPRRLLHHGYGDATMHRTTKDVYSPAYTMASFSRDLQEVPTCELGYIDCLDGYVRGTGTSCYDECNGQCCVDEWDDVCQGLTGKVCRDGSCSGRWACTNTKAAHIVNSCNATTYSACQNAGAGGDGLGDIVNSCLGGYSCSHLRQGSSVVSNLVDSCHGVNACSSAFYNSKVVGDMNSCCNAVRACYHVTELLGECGSVTPSPPVSTPPSCAAGYVDCDWGYVRGSDRTCVDECTDACCVGKEACQDFTGKVCKDGSCIGDKACRRANVAHIVQSCRTGTDGVSDDWGTDGYQCDHAGFGTNHPPSRGLGILGDLVNSCQGGYSCFHFRRYSGVVSNIIDSCHGQNACSNAYHSSTLAEGLHNCCKSAQACWDDTLIPEECEEPVLSTPPSALPSSLPSRQPSTQPSSLPSVLPSSIPSMALSSQPSHQASSLPSVGPSQLPSSMPSAVPSSLPSAMPSSIPSRQPSTQPSSLPSVLPSSIPSMALSSQPSRQASSLPSVGPSQLPSSMPSAVPSSLPSAMPSSIPSRQPSTQSSSLPSVLPSSIPSSQPSRQASFLPSVGPSQLPSSMPSAVPSVSAQPSKEPSPIPSAVPTAAVTTQPTKDFDECMSKTSNRCHPNAMCTNNRGNYTCTCPEGWVGNGFNCATRKPTEKPTRSPSSFPSMAPSVVEQSITTKGEFSTSVDICSMPPAQQTAFANAAIDSVKSLLGCSEESGCTMEQTQVCGSSARRGLRTSSRNLQTSSYQMSYELTQKFTCERASCDSPSDAATTQHLIASIVDPIEAALSSGQFLVLLSTNMVSSGTFSADVGACLEVWGAIGVEGLAVNPAQGASTGLFYPDWEKRSGTCLQDGNQPMHMEMTPDQWLFDNLEACCDRYFPGWNLNKCLNKKGSGLWYVSHQLMKCVIDCNKGQGKLCGGLSNPASNDHFANPRSCCESQLPWRHLEFCEAESLQSNCYAGTGKYYRGDQTRSSDVCVKDCDYAATGDATCGGFMEDAVTVLHDTPGVCCSNEYNWMTSELCVARTTQTDTNLFWPDKTNSKCLLDWETPAQDLSVPVYKSITECCKKGVHWLSEQACLTNSGTSTAVAATNKFFVNWEKMRCILDSKGTSKSPEPWDALFDTVSECCNKIPHIPEEDCSGARLNKF